ncbi:MAG: hypothetical protein WC834_02515 [Eubacteriales bacterium]
MPSQLWEWIVGDWKQKFTVTGVAYTQTGGDILGYDPQEGADVAGVNPAVNLYNLATKPRKELGKLWGSMFNPLNPLGGLGTLEGEFWTDLDTSVERDMWARLVGGRGSGGSHPFLYNLAERAFADSSGTPLNFMGQGVFKDEELWTAGLTGGSLKAVKKVVTGKTDVYEDLAGNILGFVAAKKNVLQRNPQFTRMQNSFIEAAATELGAKRANIYSALNVSSGATQAHMVDIQIQNLLLEADVVDSLSGFGTGMLNFSKVISKNGLKGLPGQKIIDSTVGLNASISELRTSISKARDRTTDSMGRIKGIVDPVTLDAFNRDIKGIENILTRAEAFSTKIGGNSASWAPSKLEAHAVLSEINVISGSLNNLRYGAGAQGNYLMSVTRRHFRGTNSLLKLNDPLLSQGYRSLDALYPYLERTYMYEDGRDIVQTIMKGNFPKIYLWWGKLSPMITHFTPAYWTGKLFESTHKFGLDYDDKWEGKELFSFFKAGRNPLIIENKFRLGFTTSAGTVSGLDVVGGEYLGTAKSAWDSFRKGKLVSNLTAATPYGNTAQQTQALFDFVNGKEDDFLIANVGMSYIGVFGNDVGDAQGQARKFKAFLVANANRLGLRLNTAGTDVANDSNNITILEGLFKSLGQRKSPGNVDPFAHYYGALQWASAKLTGVQQYMFSKVGKFFAPVILAKNAAYKVASDFVGRVASKILLKVGITAALGAATGGLAAFLAPLIEKVIQATLARLADKAKDLLRALLKGNLVGEFNKIMDEGARATEKALTCGCLVPAFLGIACLMLMGNIISSISPIDRAKKAISEIASDVVPPRPPDIAVAQQNNCVSPTYTITTLSYAGADNPPVGSTAVVSRHGSNYYWSPKDSTPYNSAIDGLKDCSLYIPFFDGVGTRARGPVGDAVSWCSGLGSLQTYYGYALDVVPAPVGSDAAWVYAPKLGGVTQWSLATVSRVATIGVGCHVTLNGSDAAHNYVIYFEHLECASVPPLTWAHVNPGNGIARLFDYSGGKHAHIEMKVDGAYVKPEEWLCR